MARKQPTFEEALKQLESITQQIERGEIGLEESIAKYEEGMKLINQCRTILDRAEQRVQRLQPESDGDREAPPEQSDSTSSEESAGCQ